MRFDLEVVRSEEGVLSGSIDWAGQSSPHSFHGTLEMLALLESATTPPPPEAAPAEAGPHPSG